MRFRMTLAVGVAGVVAVSLLQGMVGVANADLVAHWTLDDGVADPNSLTAVDSVAPAANGTWQNVTAPRWTTGVINGAAAFGGSATSTDRDDDIEIPTTVGSPGDKLNISGALTLTAWVNYQELGGSLSTRHIAGKDRNGGASQDAYSLKHNMTSSANTLQFLIASSGINTNVTSTKTLTQYTAASQRNGWVNVAGVFDPGQSMKLYVDGVLDAQLTTSVPPSIDVFPNTIFTIGRLYSDTTHSFHGGIDDVQIYNQALTAADIAALVAAVPIAAGLKGDFNADGVVNAADYVVWRKNLNGGVALPNDDGLGTPIGPNHYALWRSNFGLPSGSGTGLNVTAVPEPSAAFLSLLLLFGLGIRGPWSRGMQR